MGRVAMKLSILLVVGVSIFSITCQQPPQNCTETEEGRTRIWAGNARGSYVEVCITGWWSSLRDKSWDTYGAEYVCNESNFTSNGTGSWASSDFQMPQDDGHCILCEGSRLNCSIDECTGYPALVACAIPLLTNILPTSCVPTQPTPSTSSIGYAPPNASLIVDATNSMASEAATMMLLSTTISTSIGSTSASNNYATTTPTSTASSNSSIISSSFTDIPSTSLTPTSSHTAIPFSAEFPSKSIATACNNTTTTTTVFSTIFTSAPPPIHISAPPLNLTTAPPPIPILTSPPISTSAPSSVAIPSATLTLIHTSYVYRASTVTVSAINMPCTPQSPTLSSDSTTNISTTPLSLSLSSNSITDLPTMPLSPSPSSTFITNLPTNISPDPSADLASNLLSPKLSSDYTTDLPTTFLSSDSTIDALPTSSSPLQTSDASTTTSSPTLTSDSVMVASSLSLFPSQSSYSSSSISTTASGERAETNCAITGGFLGLLNIFMAVIIVLMFIGWVMTCKKGRKKLSVNLRNSEVYEILDQRTVSASTDMLASTCSIDQTISMEENNYSTTSSPPPAVYDVIRDKHFFTNTLKREGDEDMPTKEPQNRDSQSSDAIYHVLEPEDEIKIPEDLESIIDSDSDKPQEYEVPLQLMTPDTKSNVVDTQES